MLGGLTCGAALFRGVARAARTQAHSRWSAPGSQGCRVSGATTQRGEPPSPPGTPGYRPLTADDLATLLAAYAAQGRGDLLGR